MSPCVTFVLDAGESFHRAHSDKSDTSVARYTVRYAVVDSRNGVGLLLLLLSTLKEPNPFNILQSLSASLSGGVRLFGARPSPRRS